MRTWGLLGGTLLASAVASLWAQPAVAAQCATVSFSPATVNVPAWDPITPSAQQASFTMTVTRLNTATTGVRLMFLDNNDQSQPVRLGLVAAQSGPQYQVLDSSGSNVVYPKGSDVTTLRGQPAFTWQNKNSNNAVSGTFRVYVPANTPGTDFGNGTYSETLNYAIQCLNNGNVTNLVDGPTSGPVMSLTIPNLVSLTTASTATLDFQDFTSLTQTLNIGLKSTGPVHVVINTDNGMKMLRAGAPSAPPDNSKIDYQMSLATNGTPTNIASVPATLSNQQRATVAGTTWPLVLTLPATPSGKVAGSYSDTIRLTLTPES